jgi:hypothetical protein
MHLASARDPVNCLGFGEHHDSSRISRWGSSWLGGAGSTAAATWGGGGSLELGDALGDPVLIGDHIPAGRASLAAAPDLTEGLKLTQELQRRRITRAGLAGDLARAQVPGGARQQPLPVSALSFVVARRRREAPAAEDRRRVLRAIGARPLAIGSDCSALNGAAAAGSGSPGRSRTGSSAFVIGVAGSAAALRATGRGPEGVPLRFCRCFVVPLFAGRAVVAVVGGVVSAARAASRCVISVVVCSRRVSIVGSSVGI